MDKCRALPVEIVFTATMVAILLAFSLWKGLPIRLPQRDATAFVSIHYMLPLAAVFVCGLCALMASNKTMVRDFALPLPCYAIVLIVHFNLKLWAPFINPRNYDAQYWAVDQALYPIVKACGQAREALSSVIPYSANMYMIGFMLLFYGSFCFHALRTPHVFRKIFLAALFLQGLGAIAYLLAPALGPFIYEPGVNPITTDVQRYMLDAHNQALAGGPGWISANAPKYILAALGAMPSLHAGASFLFLFYAVRYARPLLIVYVPLFLFIVITSIATRWHYIVDLPAGFALALLCIVLAEYCTRGRKAAAEPQGVLIPATV